MYSEMFEIAINIYVFYAIFPHRISESPIVEGG